MLCHARGGLLDFAAAYRLTDRVDFLACFTAALPLFELVPALFATFLPVYSISCFWEETRVRSWDFFMGLA